MTDNPPSSDEQRLADEMNKLMDNLESSSLSSHYLATPIARAAIIQVAQQYAREREIDGQIKELGHAVIKGVVSDSYAAMRVAVLTILKNDIKVQQKEQQ